MISMIRLLWKELTYNWWLTLAACGVGLLLMLSGDPVFWSDQLTQRSLWLWLVVLLMGLRAYSSELGGDTMQFLGSRPIRWWQIWIAKLAAGLLQIVIVSVVCGVIYALLAPAAYRPFMAAVVQEGVFRGFWLLSVSYMLGLTASVLMPGVPLSFAALVMLVVLLAAPLTILSQIARSGKDAGTAQFAAAMGGNTALLCGAVAPIVSMVIARGLTRLSAQRRWAVCVSFLLAAVVLGSITAGVWGNIDPSKNKPESNCISLSPDGKWAVYGVTKDKQSRTYLVDTSTGQRCLTLPDAQQLGCSWSRNSSKLAYWGRDTQVRIVTIRPRRSLGPLVQVQSAPGRALSWSPSGDRLAVIDPTRLRVTQTYRVAHEGTVEPISSARDLPILMGRRVLRWPGPDGGRFTKIEISTGNQNGRNFEPDS